MFKMYISFFYYYSRDSDTIFRYLFYILGYFLFGTKLTRLQMQCFGTKRVVICTPECDDTGE